ncbi:transposase [Pedobacter psychrodurus]|uniref:Transposase n=1 Tax=Pedobacter psychrodurus TaxID=2530456 RepID=A0A4R0PXR1_9SPHI|nr:transposase [Pedobacter psychrodurus]TCD27742.1 transposase [Pedobacter psychrodurus]
MKIEEGCCYHIYNRGNNKGKIFFEDENYIFFLKQFKNYVLPSVDVLAYCLMPNHFHFFIRIKDRLNFEKGIKNMLISYTKAINQSYNRVGGLWQGRYKSKKVDSETYYTRIITYIHQNPLTSGLVKKMEDYKYSSFSSYLSDEPSSICKSEVLELFGGLAGFITDHRINDQ